MPVLTFDYFTYLFEIVFSLHPSSIHKGKQIYLCIISGVYKHIQQWIQLTWLKQFLLMAVHNAFLWEVSTATVVIAEWDVHLFLQHCLICSVILDCKLQLFTSRFISHSVASPVKVKTSRSSAGFSFSQSKLSAVLCVSTLCPSTSPWWPLVLVATQVDQKKLWLELMLNHKIGKCFWVKGSHGGIFCSFSLFLYIGELGRTEFLVNYNWTSFFI